jgi:hypothetical protein
MLKEARRAPRALEFCGGRQRLMERLVGDAVTTGLG